MLDRALVDMFSGDSEIKQDVLEWLCLSNIDFIEACERACFDPKGVYKAFKFIQDLLKGETLDDS